jgi:uncharacterized protein YbjT (DUF2867 family)
MSAKAKARILVIGSTGYVGSRLVPLLMRAGYRVRCLVRHPIHVQSQWWMREPEKPEIVTGDVLRPETLPKAMEGVSTIFYLVHNMANDPVGFARLDLAAARNCGQVAREQGVKRIVYLGGLGDPEAELSEHLRSRHDTGEALREAGIPVTEFRAAVIIGAGSLSFELVRYLTERLPFMICPKWVSTRTQPIAIGHVLEYLMGALTHPKSAGKIIEIGGSDVLTYGGLMKLYSKVRGLRRFLIPIPFLTPRLSSYWIRLVTPIPTGIARPLIDGLRNEVVVRNDLAATLFPRIKPMDCHKAIEKALSEGEKECLSKSLEPVTESEPVRVLSEGIYRERRHCRVNAAAAQMFAVLGSLGGRNGWPTLNWAWQLRGWVDKCLGGVGMRRSETVALIEGHTLDFWRIEIAEPNWLLRLRAEMKLPGKAWLQFRIIPFKDGTCELIQTALFESSGLAGVLYWYALYPLHCWIFWRMLHRLAAQAEEPAESMPA